jgi:hypothetical protein
MTDRNERIAEIFLDYLNAQEASCVNARRQIGELFNVAEPTQQKAVVEQTFLCLKFEPQEGQKIGAYDVAYEPQNLPQNWTYAMNVLRTNKAVIEKRYHGSGYQFSYWLYGEHKIYRQKLKQV